MVTPLGGRIRVANKEEGTRKPEGDVRIPRGVPIRQRVFEVKRHPVPAIRPLATRQFPVKRGVTEAKSEV